MRAASLKNLPAGDHPLSREFHQAEVLAGGGHRARDGPVDYPIVRQNHQGGAGFGAGERAILLTGFSTFLMNAQAESRTYPVTVADFTCARTTHRAATTTTVAKIRTFIGVSPTILKIYKFQYSAARPPGRQAA